MNDGALGGKEPRRGFADPGSASGDDGDLVANAPFGHAVRTTITWLDARARPPVKPAAEIGGRRRSGGSTRMTDYHDVEPEWHRSRICRKPGRDRAVHGRSPSWAR